MDNSLQKTSAAYDQLSITVTNAVTKAERVGLNPSDVLHCILGDLSVRPGYPQDLITQLVKAAKAAQEAAAQDEVQRDAYVAAVRTAVGLALELDEEDARQILVDYEAQSWTNPETFGTVRGTAKWCEVIGDVADNQYMLVVVYRDEVRYDEVTGMHSDAVDSYVVRVA